MRRLVSLLVLLVLVLIAIMAIALTYFVRSPFPKTRGSIELAGLQGEVTVRRDELGVAHIYAQSEYDLYYAQGYTHAQDRFWQMEFWRHIGLGRVSEIVGSSTIETDKFIRNLGWNRVAEISAENYQQNSPEIWAILEAYSDGVNAWIEENQGDISLNQTVLELSAGEWEIEPWEPLHTVAWGVVMAWDLRGANNINSEQVFVELENALGKELVEQIYLPYPEDRPVIVPSHSAESSNAPDPSVAVDFDQFEMIGAVPAGGFALGEGSFVGSNNWVVSGEHTVSGLPLLADDPHLGVQMPSIWYWNSLHAPGLDVAGMSFAGVPGVVIGHNNDIAWGVTNMSADSQDVYVEKINPDDPTQYEYDGEWRDMEIIREEIKVNGGETIVLEVHKTLHGPLLNNIDEELEQALSVRWTAFEPSRIFEAVIELNKATDYDEFRAALSKWDTSPQNVVYADVEGNIAYQSTGLYPIRDGWVGTRPVDGSTSEFEWDGFIPFDEMPAIFNPEAGFIATANNAIVDEDFPYYLARDWGDGNRAERITQLLEAAIGKGKISAETFQTIQNDNYELLIEQYQPLFDGMSSDDELVQAALERLRGWDGQLSEASVPGAVFEVFLWKLAEGMLADDVGEQADAIIGNGGRMRILLNAMANDADNAFWDDQTTSETETQQQIVEDAVINAVDWLGAEFGRDMTKWNWGSIHQITFASNPLGESGIAPLEMLVNRGPFPLDGGSSIVNANSFRWGDDNFGDVTANPSMRMIVDLANFDDSLAIHPTGQSGHPFNRHYNDMVPLWLSGEYHPFAFSTARIEEMTDKTLTLKPR